MKKTLIFLVLISLLLFKPANSQAQVRLEVNEVSYWLICQAGLEGEVNNPRFLYHWNAVDFFGTHGASIWRDQGRRSANHGSISASLRNNRLELTLDTTFTGAYSGAHNQGVYGWVQNICEIGLLARNGPITAILEYWLRTDESVQAGFDPWLTFFVQTRFGNEYEHSADVSGVNTPLLRTRIVLQPGGSYTFENTALIQTAQPFWIFRFGQTGVARVFARLSTENGVPITVGNLRPRKFMLPSPEPDSIRP